MVTARDGTPKFKKSEILRDDGCPTCGSMDFGVMEIKNSENVVEKNCNATTAKSFGTLNHEIRTQNQEFRYSRKLFCRQSRTIGP